MHVIRVDTSNAHIYHNLAQAYEAEFSPITQKCPDKDGLFALDTPLDAAHRGYLAYDEGLPVGIANISVNGVYEVCEFYIVPLFRHRKLGTLFIQTLWRRHPGSWQIKQIAGAAYATAFWQRAIGDFGVDYQQDTYDDPYWGAVTRQTFTVPPHPLSAAAKSR